VTSCVLCDGLRPTTQRSAWNEPLWESPNFVVIPSLGALVEGWVLIVTKQHAIAMGALSDPLLSELNNLKWQVAGALSEHYNSSVCVFEHGPSQEGCRLGCGVDHAHMHIVPIEFDLRRAVGPYMPHRTEWRPAHLLDCRAAFESSTGYLYFEQPIGFGQIATAADFESQLFRRAIATTIGLAEQFRWREHPQLRNVEATIQGAHAWNTKLAPCPEQAAA
jgi:ATP adenylyltransferase